MPRVPPMATGAALYAFFGLGRLPAGLGHFGGPVVGVAGVLGLPPALCLVRAARSVPETQAQDDLPALRRQRFRQVNAVQWLLIAAIAAIAVRCGTGSRR